MKYLYDYECEKMGLSSKDELQQAIDGNRREGRRSSYGHYAEMVGATPPPAGNRNNSHHTSPLALVSRTMNGHGMHASSSGEEDNGNSLSSTPSHHHHSVSSLPAQQEALNLEVKASNNNNNITTSNSNGNSRDSRARDRDVLDSRAAAVELTSRKFMEEALSGPPAKRFMPSDDERYLLTAGGFPSAHIKISSRGKTLSAFILPLLTPVSFDSRCKISIGEQLSRRQHGHQWRDVSGSAASTDSPQSNYMSSPKLPAFRIRPRIKSNVRITRPFLAPCMNSTPHPSPVFLFVPISILCKCTLPSVRMSLFFLDSGSRHDDAKSPFCRMIHVTWAEELGPESRC